jgi:hypothetical protein
MMTNNSAQSCLHRNSTGLESEEFDRRVASCSLNERNHLTIHSAASHTGMYCYRYTHGNARLDVLQFKWRGNSTTFFRPSWGLLRHYQTRPWRDLKIAKLLKNKTRVKLECIYFISASYTAYIQEKNSVKLTALQINCIRVYAFLFCFVKN